MKVKELIELLEKQNQDADVKVRYASLWQPVINVTGNPQSCVTEVKIHPDQQRDWKSAIMRN
jgi:hypothetical protein